MLAQGGVHPRALGPGQGAVSSEKRRNLSDSKSREMYNSNKDRRNVTRAVRSEAGNDSQSHSESQSAALPQPENAAMNNQSTLTVCGVSLSVRFQAYAGLRVRIRIQMSVAFNFGSRFGGYRSFSRKFVLEPRL